MKRIRVIGQRDYTNDSGEKVIDLSEKVKMSDLVKTPIEQYRKYFKGTAEEYADFLRENGLTRDQLVSSTKQDFFNNIENYVKRFHQSLDERFDPELLAVRPADIAKNSNVLQNIGYNLKEFSDDEFKKIVERFKQNYDSSSLYDFLIIDERNKMIHTVTSTKQLYHDTNAHKFYVTTENRGNGELSYGLNMHVKNLKRVNTIMLTQAQKLYETIKDVTGEDLAFMTAQGEREYYRFNLFGDEPTEDELKLIENAKEVQKKVVKESRGSMSPGTSKEYIEKTTEGKLPQQAVAAAVSQKQEKREDETIEQKNVPVSAKMPDDVIDVEIEDEKDIEAEVNRKLDAYFDYAQKQIQEARDRINDAVNHFKERIADGSTVEDAINATNQRFRNPVLKMAVQEAIAAEFLKLPVKDRIITRLKSVVVEKDQELKEKDGVISNLEEKITDKERKIELIETEYKNEIETINKTVDELTGQIDGLVSEIKEKDEHIELQETLIDELEKKNITANETIKEQSNQVSSLTAKLAASEEKNKSISQELQKANKTIEEQASQLSLLTAKLAAMETKLTAMEEANSLKEDILGQLKQNNELLSKSNEMLQIELERARESNLQLIKEKEQLIKRIEHLEAEKAKSIKKDISVHEDKTNKLCSVPDVDVDVSNDKNKSKNR